MNIRISYSNYDLYKTSQLQFYFKHIAKVPYSDPAIQAYGFAGNAVHSALEKYLTDGTNMLKHYWIKYDIDNLEGIRGAKLSYDLYKQMFEHGCKIIDEIKTPTAFAELKFNFKFHNTDFIGFIDYCDLEIDEPIILDYKSDSVSTYKKHKEQRLFYTWAIWKLKNIIPECKWVYLRTGKIEKDKFTIDELKAFDLELIKFIDEIEAKGNDITKYEPGNFKNPFNRYYTLCNAEYEERLHAEKQEIALNIKGNYVFIEGLADPKIMQGIDFATRFDLPNKYWMQKAVRDKNPGADVSNIGVMHLFNRKFNAFPIGLMDKVLNIIREYETYYNKKVHINLIDSRDKSIINYETDLKYTKTKFTERPYQTEAINNFSYKGTGIINIATGGGKTFIASEIIKLVNGRTLWIIDRKELLDQTKKALEEHLGVEVGVFQGDTMDLTQEITIATIQKLKASIVTNSALKMYLNTVNFVIVDEFHKAAAESYQKVFNKLPNTKYRLGLTATVERDDGKTPILHSLLGDIIYKIDSKELIKLGYLVKPTINFIKLPDLYNEVENYKEDYGANIIFNQIRNEKIIDLCNKTNVGKKILILTKIVEHGKTLSEQIGVPFLHGSLKKEKREEIFNNFKNDPTEVLIITQSIASEGLDIPDLDIIINAAANKGSVKSIQTLGRVLRIFKDKKTATYYDFLDCGKFTKKHSRKRIEAFESQGHEVNIK